MLFQRIFFFKMLMEIPNVSTQLNFKEYFPLQMFHLQSGATSVASNTKAEGSEPSAPEASGPLPECVLVI